MTLRSIGCAVLLHGLGLGLAPGVALAAPVVDATAAFQVRELGEPIRSDATLVWDSRRARALLVGGELYEAGPQAGAWQLVTSGEAHWEPLTTSGIGPGPHAGSAAVYDSLRDRVILLSGRPPYPEVRTSELWELRLSDPPTWSRLELSGTARPQSRFDAHLELDAHDRLVLFGGDGDAYADSAVWLLPLAESPLQWRAVELTGPGPGPRARFGAAYSAVTNRMVVFGGDHHIPFQFHWPDSYPACPAETWELSLDEPLHWIARGAAPTDSMPLPEVGGVMVPDAAGRVAWLFPGDQGYRFRDTSVWRYDFVNGTWMRVGAHPTRYGLYAGASACLERPNDALLVYGGGNYFKFGLPDGGTGTALRFDPDAPGPWSVRVPSPLVSGRTCWDPRAYFDAPTRRLLTWNSEGLWTRSVASPAPWRLHHASSTAPPTTPNPMSAIDTRRRRLLVFGGQDYGTAVTADHLWSCPLDGPAEWTRLPIGGTAPLGTSGTQCVYDVARDRVLVLPSLQGGGFSSWAYDTLQVLELAGDSPRWSTMPALGSAPVRRSDGTVVLDSLRDRLILVGGAIILGDGSYPRDVWTLTLGESAQWTKSYQGPGQTGPMARVAVAFDPTLDRMLWVAGLGLTPFDFGASGDIRSARVDDLSRWQDETPAGGSGLSGAGSAFFDAAADRMLWWNGATLWELRWPLGSPGAFGPATVAQRDGAVHVSWPAAVVEPYVARIERSVDGGRTWSALRTIAPVADGSIAFTDSLPPASGALAYRAVIERGGVPHVLGTAALTQGVAAPQRFALAPLRPNPASADVVVELATPVDADVTLELFDLAGRKVGTTRHHHVLRGREAVTFALARGLRPGLYMLRADDGHTTLHSRLAVVR